MTKSADSLVRNAAMTKTEAKPAIVAVNELFAKSPDGLREIELWGRADDCSGSDQSRLTSDCSLRPEADLRDGLETSP